MVNLYQDESNDTLSITFSLSKNQKLFFYYSFWFFISESSLDERNNFIDECERRITQIGYVDCFYHSFLLMRVYDVRAL